MKKINENENLNSRVPEFRITQKDKENFLEINKIRNVGSSEVMRTLIRDYIKAYEHLLEVPSQRINILIGRVGIGKTYQITQELLARRDRHKIIVSPYDEFLISDNKNDQSEALKKLRDDGYRILSISSEKLDDYTSVLSSLTQQKTVMVFSNSKKIIDFPQKLASILEEIVHENIEQEWEIFIDDLADPTEVLSIELLNEVAKGDSPVKAIWMTSQKMCKSLYDIQQEINCRFIKFE